MGERENIGGVQEVGDGEVSGGVVDVEMERMEEVYRMVKMESIKKV